MLRYDLQASEAHAEMLQKMGVLTEAELATLSTKKAFVEACILCTDTMRLLLEAVPLLEVRKDRLGDAMTEDLFVTDEVYKKVAGGMAFREAYGVAKAEFFERTAKKPRL